MKKESCPKCRESGKPVKEITLNSLLKESEKERIGYAPYFFCQSNDCPVVYFDESGSSVFKKEALTVRVGIKESEAPRHVCYCFDHTIEEIEEQVASTGESNVLKDIATRMKEACWCETKSPMGSCCMSTVNKYIKAAKANVGQEVAATEKGEFKDCCVDQGGPAKESSDCCSGNEEATKENTDCCSAPIKPAVNATRQLGALAACGAVFAAVLSSACCWLPLLLIAFGVSAAGVSGFFENYRFWLLAATGILLLLGFYLVYFRQERCEPGSACATPGPKLQRFNKTILWCAMIMVVLFGFFPNYIGVLQGGANTEVEIPDNLEQISLSIEGMTCEACTIGVKQKILGITGVKSAQVDYAKKQATLRVDPSVTNESLQQAVEAAGYKAGFDEPTK